MKNIIKTLSVALCLIAFFGSQQTLQAQTGQQNQTEQTEKLIEKLNLSAEQKEEFLKIQEKYNKEISQIKKQGKQSGNREKIQTLIENKNNEVKQILTQEQYEVYTTYANKKSGSRSGGRSRQ